MHVLADDEGLAEVVSEATRSRRHRRGGVLILAERDDIKKDDVRHVEIDWMGGRWHEQQGREKKVHVCVYIYILISIFI